MFVPPFALAEWTRGVGAASHTLVRVLNRLHQPVTTLWQTLEIETCEWLTLRLAMFRWLRLQTVDLSLLLGGAAPVLDTIGAPLQFRAPDTLRLVPSPHRWPGKKALPEEMLDGRHVVRLAA